MNRADPTKENADLAPNEILATEATTMPPIDLVGVDAGPRESTRLSQ